MTKYINPIPSQLNPSTTSKHIHHVSLDTEPTVPPFSLSCSQCKLVPAASVARGLSLQRSLTQDLCQPRPTTDVPSAFAASAI